MPRDGVVLSTYLPRADAAVLRARAAAADRSTAAEIRRIIRVSLNGESPAARGVFLNREGRGCVYRDPGR
jgi:plasmid stability protein